MTKGTKQMLLVAGAAVAVYFLFFREDKSAGLSVQLGDVKADAGVSLDDKESGFSGDAFDKGF